MLASLEAYREFNSFLEVENKELKALKSDNLVDKTTMSELKIKDLTFFIFFSIFFYFILILNLELGFSMTSHICYKSHDTVTSHDHIIIYYKEYCKRF